ncbi:MAG TPA: hypothetical protein DHV16_10035 [Nitrospiraceae bacterium]|nr:hypothetical protein [Nitrospiraceae bacterium]HCZ12566.1 hypothetical protein [Nitrospiraceae bacterium]
MQVVVRITEELEHYVVSRLSEANDPYGQEHVSFSDVIIACIEESQAMDNYMNEFQRQREKMMEEVSV